ncbi:Diadenosine tetraphosphate (Ap4A) HIT family hydrolase [Gammaproteobacteria bacterium]
MECELCAGSGGIVLWQDDFLRVVRVDESGYAGFCRVILQRHVAEMTDLPLAERERLMSAVWIVEGVLRRLYSPLKINLASLGNLVPHLHWHVIPRFSDDPHFPQPIWTMALRQPISRQSINDELLCAVLDESMREYGQ